MRRWLPFCLILLLLVAFRLLGSTLAWTLPNFQPLAALFFCGALLAVPAWRAFAVAFGVWAITYAAPNWLAGISLSSPAVFLTTLLAFGATFALGWNMRRQSHPKLLMGSLVAALLFHAITCGAAWIGDPRYAKTAAGLWQSLWTGAPGDVLPSWVFLRNLAAANLTFTAIFLLALARLPRVLPAPSRGLAAREI